MDVIKTDAGYVSGTVLGEPGKEVHVYRGIPYASPPLGDLRWKPPQPPASWKDIRECTVFSRIAPQSPVFSIKDDTKDDRSSSEDCLYLNILTPARKDSDKLPVMVWLHGGGYANANGNDNGVNRVHLPQRGVVLVTVNMRLGPLGCLAHPLLSRESTKGISGNYLFLDMVSALKWVQKNISAFGGNPNNVTIFGVSGGSGKVVNLMASPLARGLFHRAIGQSGGGGGTTLKEMEARGEKVFAKLGVDKEKDPLAAARTLPFEKITEAGQAVMAEMKIPFGIWDSAVDGWFLPDTIADIFKAGRQNIVPFIMGANLGELTGPGVVMMPQVIPHYVSLFTGANKAGGKGYAYIFNHVPAGWKKDGAVACHGMEMPYVFGDFDYNNSDTWTIVSFSAKTSGAKSPDPGLTDVDRKLSEMIMKVWVNFAKTGNPGLKGVIDWPAWDEATDQYFYITESPEVKSGFSRIVEK
jgi:para-nitrobenzyl esterase